MTQAISDTTNNLLYSILRQDEHSVSSYMSKEDSFKSIIEKSQDSIQQKSLTIGNLREVKNADNCRTEDFRQFLQQETKEADEESSLNLSPVENPTEDSADDNATTCTEDSINSQDTNLETCSEVVAEIPEIVQEVASALIDIPVVNELSDNLQGANDIDKLTDLESTELENTSLMSSENDLLAMNTLSDDSITVDALVNKLSTTISKSAADVTGKSSSDVSANNSEISDEMLNELNIESVDVQAETNSSEGYDLQQQSPEEHVIKAMISSDVNSDFESNAVETSEAHEIENKNINETSHTKIMEQVTKQLNGIKLNSKVDIVLNPESLGKVSIHVAKSPEGMSAQFTVSTNEAKEILLKNLDGLRESLLSHGINADNVSVKMNETQKGEYKEDWTEQNNSENKNREQHHQPKEEKEKGIFEKMMASFNSEETDKV